MIGTTYNKCSLRSSCFIQRRMKIVEKNEKYNLSCVTVIASKRILGVVTEFLFSTFDLGSLVALSRTGDQKEIKEEMTYFGSKYFEHD